VVAESTDEPETVGTQEDLSLAELEEAFKKRMYRLLLEPEVVRALERHLRSRNPKVIRDLLGVILPTLLPHEKAGRGGSASKIVLVSKSTAVA